MRRGIDCAEIGFVLDDAAGEQSSALPADQKLAEQLASNDSRVAIEEIAREPRSLPVNSVADIGDLPTCEAIEGLWFPSITIKVNHE